MKNKKKKWDYIFLKYTYNTSLFSKDPATKVGALIVDDKRRMVSSGYNGFPRKILDKKERYENRNLKYQFIIHAEVNAILNSKSDLENCTIYIYPMLPCHECAKFIIQSGIVRVVSLKEIPLRWSESITFSLNILKEAGIEISLYPKSEVNNFDIRNEDYD